jgi:hypothetical protein
MRFEAGKRDAYAADVDLKLTSLDLGKFFTTVEPGRPPVIDGTCQAAFSAHGGGADPAAAFRDARATFTLEGRGGTFRGLGKGVRSLSYLTRLAGVLTFSREIRAAGRAIATLEALPLESARLRLERVPGEGLILRSLELRTPELVGRLSGSIARKAGPFVNRPLSAELTLSAKGDVGILFSGMKLLGTKADAAGYRPVTRTFRLAGTPADPDASDLALALDEAGKNAKGAFGVGLRKANKMLAAPDG